MSNGNNAANLVGLAMGIVEQVTLWRLGVKSEGEAIQAIEQVVLKGVASFVDSSEGVTKQIGTSIEALMGLGLPALNQAILPKA